jgi:hypothetical protein
LATGLYVTDVANRDLPVLADPMPSRIHEALVGKNYEQIRAQLEDGLPEDFFAEEEETGFVELIPKIMFSEGFRRENESILKEFGW